MNLIPISERPEGDTLKQYGLCTGFDFASLTSEDFTGTMLYAEYYELDEFTQEAIKGKLSAQAKTFGLNFQRLWKIKKNEMDGAWGVPTALPAFTIEELEEALPALNISPVWDDIAATIRFGTKDRNERTTVPTIIYSTLCDKYRGVSLKIITAYLTNIALERHTNPVLTYLERTTWDRKDRFPELYKILGLEEDPLSQTLVYKWFWQGYSLLHNGRGNTETYGADGILVLTGPQGIGKTTFFRWTACKGDWFKDGCTLSKDKDEERRIVTTWIAELGEIGRTLRGDLDSLKAFVTRDFDRYRLPYASADTENPRHTNLCGTVNGEDGFLIDPTGNRRFWTVPVNNIDLEALKALDPVQIWAQVRVESWRSDHQGFRLTREERDELEKRNTTDHMKKAKGHEEIEDLLATGTEWAWMTAGEWKEREPVQLRNLSVKTIGEVLKRLGVEERSCRKGMDGKQKRARFYRLPVSYGKSPSE